MQNLKYITILLVEPKFYCIYSLYRFAQDWAAEGISSQEMEGTMEAAAQSRGIMQLHMD